MNGTLGMAKDSEAGGDEPAVHFSAVDENMNVKDISNDVEDIAKGWTQGAAPNSTPSLIERIMKFAGKGFPQIIRGKATLSLFLGFIDRHSLEVTIYRLLRATLLIAILYSLHFHFNAYDSLDEAETIFYLALIIQMGLIIKFPDNDIRPLRNRNIYIRGFLTDELQFAVIFTVAVFFLNFDLNPPLFGAALIANFVIQLLLFISWRRYKLSAYRAGKSSFGREKNVIIIGSSERGMKTADLLLKHPELKFRILGFVDRPRTDLWRYRDIPFIGTPENIHSIISRNQVDFAIMAPEPQDFLYSQKIFETVEKMGIKICLLPDIYNHTVARCCTSSLNGQPVLLYHSVPADHFALFLKAGFDRMGALAGLILSAPILLISSIAIKIDSRGSVFYKQTRIGRNGRVFEMLKLRTMTDGAEKLKTQLKHLNEMSGPVFKIKNDPRVTRVGKILRRFSIDELPQFVNVLKGDMSLVGPRPPLPKEVEQYAPWQHRRLSVKPGVTCLWQIMGRNNIDFEDWMRLDLQYIDQWSLKNDVEILARTVPVVVKGNGAS
jgi:exopolysaccharide biosynthesis polyprenyl glycosylphosphotransferase